MSAYHALLIYAGAASGDTQQREAVLDINELVVMSEDAQAALVRSLVKDMVVNTLEEYKDGVDTFQMPLWELFDSLSFMQFKAQLSSTLPIAKEALNFSAFEKPTVDLIVKKVMREISQYVRSAREAKVIGDFERGSNNAEFFNCRSDYKVKEYGKIYGQSADGLFSCVINASRPDALRGSKQIFELCSPVRIQRPIIAWRETVSVLTLNKNIDL